EKLMTLGSELKLWDRTAAEIGGALSNRFPKDKAPADSTLGKAIRNFQEALEEHDFVVRWRTKDGKSYYTIAPQRMADQINSGEWLFRYSDEGEIESILIDAHDPEAVPDGWSLEQEEVHMEALRKYQWTGEVDLLLDADVGSPLPENA